MKIYQRTWADRDGRERTTRKWYIDAAIHDGTRLRLAGYPDRGATERLARNVERLDAFRAGKEPPPEDLAEWLDEIPDRIYQKLLDVGLVDRRRTAARADLAEHVATYREHLADEGRTADHVRRTVYRINRIVDGCGFRRWGDVDAGPARAFLAELRGGGMSISTSNHYATAIKMFANWMRESGRARTTPLAGLKPLNAEPDRRRERRALTPQEIGWLLDTTAAEPERHGMDGPARALVYRLCIETGLRAGECRSLTPESFDLGDRPTVTIKAGYSKRRRRDTIPLRRDTADRLADVVARTFAGQKCFPLPRRTAEMLRADLAAARKRWVAGADTPAGRQSRRESGFLKATDASGKVIDFHALRHTTATLMAGAGVTPKAMQAIMRHSTITLTMDRYAHLMDGTDAAAVEALPDFKTGKGRDAERR